MTVIQYGNLSSSEVRQRASMVWGQQEREAIESHSYRLVEGLVPQAVLTHITRYNLYTAREQLAPASDDVPLGAAAAAVAPPTYADGAWQLRGGGGDDAADAGDGRERSESFTQDERARGEISPQEKRRGL